MKKALGILLLLIGGFLGGMTQTGLFDERPFWQTMLALVFAFGIMGSGWSLIRGK